MDYNFLSTWLMLLRTTPVVIPVDKINVRSMTMFMSIHACLDTVTHSESI